MQMANPEPDSNSNTLLCSENSNLTSDDQPHQKNDDQNLDSISYGGSSSGSTFMRFFPLFQQTEDIGLRLMYHKEKEQLPRDDYLHSLRSGKLDLTVRKDALDWMFKAYPHFGFGALTVCLAINYVDRFLSVYELPRGKTWTVQLLAVACLSLAVKMEEMHVPLSVYLQEVGDPKFIFEGKTIKRMELLVLSTLKWRMQAYTPCSFIEYFLTKVNNDEMPSKSLVNRAVQIILSTVIGIDFLEFRPSEIAAAVAMCASGERRAIDIDKALSSSIHVEKAKVFKCIELIKDLALMRNKGNAASASASSSNMPQSPAGVLEAACFSYKSDEKTVGSSQNSSHKTAPADNNKRRKLEGPSRGDPN